MKNLNQKTKFFFLLLSISTFVFLISNCNRKSSDEQCAKCTLRSDYFVKNVNFLGFQSQMKVYYTKMKNNDNYVRFSYSTSTSNSILSLIKKYDIPIETDGKIFLNLTFYSNQDVVDNMKLDKSIVSGVLMYYKENNKIRTEVYTLSNGIYYKHDPLSCETNIVTSNDITDIGFILSNGLRSYSCLSLIDFKSIGKNPKIKKSKLQLNVDYYYSKTLNTLLNVPPGNWGENHIHQCQAPCPEANGYCTAKESQIGGEQWYCFAIIVIDDDCEDCICRKDQEDNQYTHTIMSNYEVEAQNDGLRSFRDSYLNNSAKGQEYIQRYYYLSGKLKDSLDYSSSAQSIAVLINDVIPIINTLENPSDTSAILYNDSTANNIIGVLNNYKNKLTSSTDRAIIDSFISDVNFYKNKSVNFVDTHFNDL